MLAKLLLLAGCGGAQSSPDPPTRSEQPSRPAGLDGWPQRPSCGSYHRVHEQPDQVTGLSETHECILRALREGEPAEAAATHTTDEGAPIVNYIRMLGPSRVEVFKDATADTFGSQQWTHSICERLHEGPDHLWPDRCTIIAVD